MKFLHVKFQGKKKEIVEVSLDRPARVKFMTANEFKNYSGSRTHSYFGGRFEDRVIQFVLPFDSVWYVVVEKGTVLEPNDVKASCRLLPPDRNMRSSLALDAPAHVLAQARLDESEVEAISAGARSEG
jgi:hypothetical protein